LLTARIPAMRSQVWIGLCLFILAVVAAWQVGEKVAADDTRSLIYVALGFAACAVCVTALRQWRTGFYMFLVWMLFEDLVRKYMANNLALFFGKDVLLAFVYAAAYFEIRRGREKTFRPPFLFFLGLFFWLGVLQIFNQNSPHILYGLLGFKLYFYYVPLLWIGYALIRNDEDLRKFLVFNAVLACVIGGLGIAQAILGNSFLNPEHLAPELEDLGNLSKVTPLSGRVLSLPDSVFVSSSRFALYLVMAVILVLGTAAYLLLHTPRNRKLVFAVIGVLGIAVLLSGSRTAFVGSTASALALCAGFLWGAPWQWGQAHRLVRVIRRSFIVLAFGTAALLMLFPDEAGSRLSYYAETLSPNSSAYEGSSRSWDYPISNFLSAFDGPNWVLGNGIGTASLGTQYVAKLLGRRSPGIWVEEGYGDLIVEMGLIAPLLWLLWSTALLYYSWKVVRRLRKTRLYPVAFAIFWYAFLLLVPLTYGALSAYQNYSTNAFLWLLVGMLFRLPTLLPQTPAPAVVSSRPPRDPGWLGF
jgi:hypothetical protein